MCFLCTPSCCSSRRTLSTQARAENPKHNPPPSNNFQLPEHLHRSLSTPCTLVAFLLCKTSSLLSYTPPRLRNCRNHEQVPGLGKSSGGMLRHTSTVLTPLRPAIAFSRDCFQSIREYVLTLSSTGCSSSSCKSCSMRAAAKTVHRIH